MASAEVVDILDDSPTDIPEATAPPATAQLSEAIRVYLQGKDLASISLKALRRELETSFNVGPGGFDSRRDEIKQLAQEQVHAVQTAAQAPPPMSIEAGGFASLQPAKRRKGVLGAGIPVIPLATMAFEPQGKAEKKKNAPSAYILWTTDNRPRVAMELETELSRKPTFGEVCKAVSERWKLVSEADRKVYEEKARVAKANMPANVPANQAPRKQQVSSAGSSETGRGRGKGGGRVASKDDPSSSLTRADFLRSGFGLRCVLEKASGGPEAALGQPMELMPRTFKSGGAGFFCSNKITMEIAGQQVYGTAQVVVTIAGSKYWQDGEGFDSISANASVSAEGGAGSSSATPDDEPTVEEACATQDLPPAEKAEATIEPQDDLTVEDEAQPDTVGESAVDTTETDVVKATIEPQDDLTVEDEAQPDTVGESAVDTTETDVVKDSAMADEEAQQVEDSAMADEEAQKVEDSAMADKEVPKVEDKSLADGFSEGASVPDLAEPQGGA